MIVWDEELVDEQENFCAVPGQVTLVEESFVEMACQKANLKLKEVRL